MPTVFERNDEILSYNEQPAGASIIIIATLVGRIALKQLIIEAVESLS